MDLPQIEYRLLGQVEAWHEGRPVELGGRKQRAVLASLLLRAGRVVSLDQLIDALILMEANMFDFLNTILGFYANCGMSWVVVVATDIAVNKYLLKISPLHPEFRRGMLYAVNPVGFGSMIISAGVSVVAFFGGYSARRYSRTRRWWPSCSPWCCRRCWRWRPGAGTTCGAPTTASTPRWWTSTATRRACIMECHVCREQIERPDMMACAAHDDVICSLCLSQDKTGEHVLPAQV